MKILPGKTFKATGSNNSINGTMTNTENGTSRKTSYEKKVELGTRYVHPDESSSLNENLLK